MSSPASWTEGIATLLPRTDLIAFCTRQHLVASCREAGLPGPPGRGGTHAAAPPVFARWEAVVEDAGGLLAATGSYPERYRVEGFPDGEQLQAWRAGGLQEELALSRPRR